MFRFTIREWMLVILAVALGLGWWLDHRRQQAVQEWREFAEWQRDSVTRLVEAQGHKVTLFDGWRVDVDRDSIGYDESLREVPHPWRKAAEPSGGQQPDLVGTR